MIVVRIILNALPEKRLEIMQTLLSMTEAAKKELGCLSYDAFCDIEDKNCFTLLQQWESREHLDNHLRSHRFSVLLGIKMLLCEPPEIQIYPNGRHGNRACNQR